MIKLGFHKIFFQAAVIISCLFIYGCENDPQVIRSLNEKMSLTEEAKDITSIFSHSGKMRARLTAPFMRRFQADTNYIDFPNTLKVVFVDSLGRMESQLEALYGKYFENFQNFLLKDSVVVINIQGDTLRTSELWWSQQQAKFYTDKQVRITTKNKQIYGGRGMEADQDLTNIIIRYPTGTVILEEEISME